MHPPANRPTELARRRDAGDRAALQLQRRRLARAMQLPADTAPGRTSPRPLPVVVLEALAGMPPATGVALVLAVTGLTVAGIVGIVALVAVTATALAGIAVAVAALAATVVVLGLALNR